MAGGIIRPLRQDEVPSLSALISNTLLISNSRDYSLEDIAQLRKTYSTAALADMLRRGRVWVYDTDGAIRGALALQGPVIQALFVAPDSQGMGIGRKLVGVAIEWGRRMERESLEVTASLTAEPFYARVGFERRGQGDIAHIRGRTVRMVRLL